MGSAPDDLSLRVCNVGFVVDDLSPLVLGLGLSPNNLSMRERDKGFVVDDLSLRVVGVGFIVDGKLSLMVPDVGLSLDNLSLRELVDCLSLRVPDVGFSVANVTLYVSDADFVEDDSLLRLPDVDFLDISVDDLLLSVLGVRFSGDDLFL